MAAGSAALAWSDTAGRAFTCTSSLCASADGHRGPASAVPNGGSDASMARGTFIDRDLGHMAPSVRHAGSEFGLGGAWP
jgi:hypothetical protein